jgi:cysteinyl-tRNA synthetase
MNLVMYDTYKKKNIEIPLNKPIKLYSCGPTVYSYLHIGNTVAVLFPELINNIIKYCKGEVTWVCNVTDLGHLTSDSDTGEDKMELGAKKHGKSAQEIAEFYYNDFKKQLDVLNIQYPIGKLNPKASDYIYEQMYITLELLSQNKAYIALDGIYFDHSSTNDIDNSFLPKNTGNSEFTGREIVSHSKNPEDFALWKFVSEETLQKYQFSEYKELDKYNLKEDIKVKWGCPGWHTECVAMIAGVLGLNNNYTKDDFSFAKFKDSNLIDIHTGGEDHISIHHKNEIIQSQALGVNLSKYWIHNRHLKVDNQKMSKSIGNTFNVVGDEKLTGFPSIVSKNINPLAFRLLFLEHDYKEQINFTWEKLEQSQNRLHSLYKLSSSLVVLKPNNKEKNEALNEEFQSLLLNNLNTVETLELFQKELTHLVTSITNNEDLDNKTFATLQELDKEVLKLNIFQIIPKEIFDKIEERNTAKIGKDYKQADLIRTELLSNGYVIDDYKWGTGVYKK